MRKMTYTKRKECGRSHSSWAAVGSNTIESEWLQSILSGDRRMSETDQRGYQFHSYQGINYMRLTGIKVSSISGHDMRMWYTLVTLLKMSTLGFHDRIRSSSSDWPLGPVHNRAMGDLDVMAPVHDGMWPPGRLRHSLPGTVMASGPLIIDLTGADARMASDMLVGNIGLRVVNMIMTPAMFAQLARVSSDVRNIVRDIHAWEGLEIHLEYTYVKFGTIARMLSSWRLADVLYLNYWYAAPLDNPPSIFSPDTNDRRCSIAAVWRFPHVDDVVAPSSDVSEDTDVENSEYEVTNSWWVHKSEVAFPTDHWVYFDVEFPAHRMPILHVGWMCSRWKHLLFQVVPQSEWLGEYDRGRWYNDQSMSDDPAIRVPSSWTCTSPWSRLRIGLAFTLDIMSLSINNRQLRAEIEPQFREDWSQFGTLRHVILVTYGVAGPVLPRIRPVPWVLPGAPGRRLTW